MDTDPLRSVVMLRTANPAVVRFRTMTPDLAPVIGRFMPARYDAHAHAFEVPANLADQLATFLRAHGIGVVNAPTPEEVDRYAPSAETARILAESRERASHPDEQRKINERGMVKVRVALATARHVRER